MNTPIGHLTATCRLFAATDANGNPFLRGEASFQLASGTTTFQVEAWPQYADPQQHYKITMGGFTGKLHRKPCEGDRIRRYSGTLATDLIAEGFLLDHTEEVPKHIYLTIIAINTLYKETDVNEIS